MKKNLLIVGWIDIPHSYAIVNTNQIIALIKKYGNFYNFYIKEYPYPDIYKNKWLKLNQSLYSKEHQELLDKKLKKYDANTKIHLIYSITFPYDINIYDDIPKVVFFTAEYKELNPTYFNLDEKIIDDEIIKQQFENKNLHMTSPSDWSVDSLKKYKKTNTCIPHGIDPEIFKINKTYRKSIRDKYNIKDNEIVYLQLGSMTSNKGIIEILISFIFLVSRMNIHNIKLMLKGSSDLYDSKKMLDIYFDIVEKNGFSKDEIEIGKQKIVYIEKTLTFNTMSNIYNACDIYVSPYKAEGFNMTVLEALACGMNVIVSDNGSTKFFVDDIKKNSDDGIYILPTNVITDVNTMLNFDINNLIKLMIESSKNVKDVNEKRVKYIHDNWSWSNVADKLHELFQKII